MKTNSSPPSFPQVHESDASGLTAEIYEDIKATLDVPFVNLIWRRIAAVPGALGPTWQGLKPAYESGQVQRAAGHLKETIKPPRYAAPSPALFSADTRAITYTLLQHYEFANLINLAAFSALVAVLDQRSAPVSPLAASLKTRPPLAAPIAEGQALPKALKFEDVTAPTAALVERFNGLAAFPETERQQATLPLTLAHWPDVLVHAIDVLAPLEAGGRLTQDMTQLREHSEGAARSLSADMPPLNLPDDMTRAIHAILIPFIPASLIRMIIIIAALKPAFEEHP